MAGKRPPAPRQENAPRTIPVHRPGPPERQAHNVIAALLRKNYGNDAELPAPDALRPAGMFFANYVRNPWGDAEGVKHTEGLRKYKQERRIFQNAARILRADLAHLRPTEAREADAITEHRAWQIAVAVLENARPPLLHDIDDVSEQGAPMRGWTHVARMMAQLLAPPLRGLDAPISTRKTSAFVKTLKDLLLIIYGEDKSPSCSAISKAIAKFDAND